MSPPRYTAKKQEDGPEDADLGLDDKVRKLLETQERIRAAPARSISDPVPPAKKPFNSKKDEKVLSPEPAPSPTSPSDPPSPRGSSPNPTLDAILALTRQMEQLSFKSDKIDQKMGGMATKEDLGKMQKGLCSKLDLQNMEASISKNTKIHIAEAVDPIKSEICDLRLRVQKIEDAGGSNPGGSSQSAHGGASTISPEIQKMLNSLDPPIKELLSPAFPKIWHNQNVRNILKNIYLLFPRFQNLRVLV